jgi:hypothetical protein
MNAVIPRGAEGLKRASLRSAEAESAINWPLRRIRRDGWDILIILLHPIVLAERSFLLSRTLLDQEIDGMIAVVRAQLDEATWKAVWAEGRSLALEQAVAQALDE